MVGRSVAEPVREAGFLYEDHRVDAVSHSNHTMCEAPIGRAIAVSSAVNVQDDPDPGATSAIEPGTHQAEQVSLEPVERRQCSDVRRLREGTASDDAARPEANRPDLLDSIGSAGSEIH
jgi:hypothetical protein